MRLGEVESVICLDRKGRTMVGQKESIDYYDSNASTFYEGTVNADMSKLQDKFLSQLVPKGKILDLGCGSGRDSLAFIKKGFRVSMIDPSEEMCRFAETLTGQKCDCMKAQDIQWDEEFDGIWACASLLHVGEKDTAEVYHKLERAIKHGGIIFVTYKYGEGEKQRGERCFYDMNEDGFSALLDEQPELEIKETWITTDVRPGRGEEKWFNAILMRR